MHYEMRQVYDPVMNPHMNCNHPANYYMVSSSGGIEPPRRLSYLEAAKGFKPVPSPTVPTPKAKILSKAPTAKQLQYGSKKPYYNNNKYFTKSYKAAKCHKFTAKKQNNNQIKMNRIPNHQTTTAPTHTEMTQFFKKPMDLIIQENRKLKMKVKNIIKEVLKIECEYGIKILKNWMINDSSCYDDNIKFLNKLNDMTPEDPLFKALNDIQLQEDIRSNKYDNSFVNMLEDLTSYETDDEENEIRPSEKFKNLRYVDEFEDSKSKEQSKIELHILNLFDDHETSSNFHLMGIKKHEINYTIRTWVNQLMQKYGNKIVRIMYNEKPTINEEKIRSKLRAGHDNIPIEDAIYSHDKPSGQGKAIYQEMINEIKSYEYYDTQLYGLITNACKKDQEINNYIDKIERETTPANRPKMSGKKLFDYIKNNFDRERDLHSAIKKEKLATLEIKSTATKFLIEAEKLIEEIIRLGDSEFNRAKELKSILMRVLIKSPTYRDFYHSLTNTRRNANNTDEQIIEEIKDNLISFDERKFNEYKLSKTKEYNYKLNNDITCHNCGKKGHYKKDCRSPTKTSNNLKHTFKKKLSYKTNKANMKNFERTKYNANVNKFRMKCFKCGGEHRALECNYNFQSNPISNNREEKLYFNISDIGNQPGEEYETNELYDDEEPPSHLRMLMDEEEEYSNDDPSSSSRSFSYNLTTKNSYLPKRFPLIDLTREVLDLTNEEDERSNNEEKLSHPFTIFRDNYNNDDNENDDDDNNDNDDDDHDNDNDDDFNDEDREIIYDDNNFNPEMIDEDKEIIYEDKELDGYVYYQVMKYYKTKGSNKKVFPNISEFKLETQINKRELKNQKSVDTEEAECLIRIMDDELDDTIDFELQNITDEAKILHDDTAYTMRTNDRENNCFIDSGCSKTALKSRKFFQKVYECNRKVSGANGKIDVKYSGDSGPIKDCHWIPSLTDNLVSMADLINLGITINIRPNGNMRGFLNGKVVLSAEMNNNVWKCDITELFKNIQNVQNESNNDKSQHYNKESMNDKTKY